MTTHSIRIIRAIALARQDKCAFLTGNPGPWPLIDCKPAEGGLLAVEGHVTVKVRSYTRDQALRIARECMPQFTLPGYELSNARYDID